VPSEVSLPLNTLWVVVAAILVFFMQAGFALLESGLVRAKNAVNVLLKNYSDMCVGAVAFWGVGYGLMFGANATGWFGTSKFAVNGGDGWDLSVLFFQMMFAATAATIVSGALAERIRFGAYLIGSVLITGLIYPLVGGWAWNEGGWLKKLGFLDFAGSTVVHSIGAWCALAGVLALGPRTGRYAKDGSPRSIPGHNQPFVALGGLILWFGWFGFNAGSTTEANADLGKIALNTHLSGAVAATAVILIRTLVRRPLTVGAVVNGSLGGLVGITAGCAYVTPVQAVMIGAAAAIVVELGGLLLNAFELDDAVGAIPVHGLCGVWGTLAVGLFAPEGKIGVQLLGVGVVFLVVTPAAFVMYKLIALTGRLRVESVDEQRGLDFSEHAEVGYPEFQVGLLHSGTGDVSADTQELAATPVGRK
jgi:Amt family ammonium transporter